MNAAIQEESLNLVFAALADPTRRAILARLAQGEATVNELAEPFDMSLPAVSKHLKVLEGAGLVARGREGQRRPARLEPEALETASRWIERYRKMWEESFDRLEIYLKKIQAEQARTTKKKRTSRRKQ